MSDRDIARLASTARKAVPAGDWSTVAACARRILESEKESAEGHFLAGLAAKARAQPREAEVSLERALRVDSRRYDAAIELADLYAKLQRNSEAMSLLDEYASHLENSPLYLGMAAATYARLDLHKSAWALYRKACDLQPQIESFQAGLAASSVFIGKTEEAKTIYEALLQRHPNHQRYHYQLARLAEARDFRHVDRMRGVLRSTRLPPEQNIFIYYALGKELEDLGAWNEAFDYYRIAGAAAKQASGYEVETDLAVIDAVVSVSAGSWKTSRQPFEVSDYGHEAIFVVGLPRAGTTLVERIIASHSEVRSIGETYSLQSAIRRESGVDTAGSTEMTPEIVKAAAAGSAGAIRSRYMDAIAYKLGGERLFIEKLPGNWVYLGFIARSFPKGRIVHVRRNPMDACFALFKQSWFRYAYTLEDVGRYYVAYARAMSHWRDIFGERIVEIEYEALVADQQGETRRLLDRLGLDFEDACLQFERNETPTATASAIQVREKIHTRSVGRWRRFEAQLSSLRSYLEREGIGV